jgi:hypothetical protein
VSLLFTYRRGKVPGHAVLEFVHGYYQMFSVNQILRQILKQQELWVLFLKEGDVPFSVSKKKFIAKICNFSQKGINIHSYMQDTFFWVQELRVPEVWQKKCKYQLKKSIG